MSGHNNNDAAGGAGNATGGNSSSAGNTVNGATCTAITSAPPNSLANGLLPSHFTHPLPTLPSVNYANNPFQTHTPLQTASISDASTVTVMRDLVNVVYV